MRRGTIRELARTPDMGDHGPVTHPTRPPAAPCGPSSSRSDWSWPRPGLAAATEFPAGYTGFHSYTEIAAETAAVAAAHPDIAQRFSIGKSHQGRDLWAMKISDNVATDENEPEVLFDGSHHADEHMAAEMTLRIMHWLVDGYGSDTRITNIVNSREVWIVFLVNPDGAEYDISGGQVPLLAQEPAAHARYRLHRDGPQPELRLSLGRRRQHELEPGRDHLPRSVRLLGAGGARDARLPGQPRGRRQAADPGRHHVPRSTAGSSCGRTATPTRTSRPT